MISKEDAQEIVRKKIEKDEKIGCGGSKSGHKSNVSYQIDDIKMKSLKDNTTQIHYSYTLYIETEFTYYPDNPPYEYHQCTLGADQP